MKRADTALVVRGDGHGLEDTGDLVVGKAVLAQALLGAVHHELLGAGAGRHALGLDADEPSRSARGGNRGAEHRVDLLGRQARHGGSLVLRVAGGDRDLGAATILTVAYALSDVRGECLRLEGGLAEDHLVDRLVHDLLEARHVRALLLGAQIDEALELCVEQLLGAVRADADNLLDACNAHARQAHLGGGPARLHVRTQQRISLVHGRSQRYTAGHQAIAQVVVHGPRALQPAT